MENVTTSDPCDLCQCDNGYIVCAQRVCPNLLPGSIPEGCREVRAEGECCPTFECAQVEEQVQETTARPAEESVGQTLSTSREPKPLEGGVTVPIMGLQTTTPPAASEEEESSTQTVEAATQSENVGETTAPWGEPNMITTMGPETEELPEVTTFSVPADIDTEGSGEEMTATTESANIVSTTSLSTESASEATALVNEDVSEESGDKPEVTTFSVPTDLDTEGSGAESTTAASTNTEQMETTAAPVASQQDTTTTSALADEKTATTMAPKTSERPEVTTFSVPEDNESEVSGAEMTEMPDSMNEVMTETTTQRLEQSSVPSAQLTSTVSPETTASSESADVPAVTTFRVPLVDEIEGSGAEVDNAIYDDDTSDYSYDYDTNITQTTTTEKNAEPESSTTGAIKTQFKDSTSTEEVGSGDVIFPDSDQEEQAEVTTTQTLSCLILGMCGDKPAKGKITSKTLLNNN